jgi:hypothetical protein
VILKLSLEDEEGGSRQKVWGRRHFKQRKQHVQRPWVGEAWSTRFIKAKTLVLISPCSVSIFAFNSSLLLNSLAMFF